MVRIQNMRPLAFKLIPWEFFEKLIILSKMEENNFLEKCVLELCRTAMIKPRHLERSGFFLLDHNGQTRIYRLVLGQSDAWLWRNRDFQTDDDDLENCALELFWTATIKPRQIERSCFYILDHNGQTWIYWLVSGQLDVRLWRNRDFSTKDDVCPPPTPRSLGLNFSSVAKLLKQTKGWTKQKNSESFFRITQWILLKWKNRDHFWRACRHGCWRMSKIIDFEQNFTKI